MERVPKKYLAVCLKSLGCSIVTLRTEFGIDQTQLAFEANIGLSTLRRIEKGTANPTLHTVIAIAHALNVHPAALWNFNLQPDFFEDFESVPCPFGKTDSCAFAANGKGK